MSCVMVLETHFNKNLIRWKSAIYHSIKVSFDTEFAEKILKCYLIAIAPGPMVSG